MCARQIYAVILPGEAAASHRLTLYTFPAYPVCSTQSDLKSASAHFFRAMLYGLRAPKGPSPHSSGLVPYELDAETQLSSHPLLTPFNK